MAKRFFDIIAASGGFAGEYEALTEAEIATAPGAAYAPPEEFGVFRVVASRVVQLLGDAPIFVETYQTSAATLRVPSGLTATNDAEDGRFFFLKNNSTATGDVSIEDHLGTLLKKIRTGDMVVAVHSENNTWTVSNPITGTDGFGTAMRYTHDSGIPASGTRYLRTGQSILCSSAGDRLINDVRMIGMSIRTNATDAVRDYDVEFIRDPSGSPVVLATLPLPSGSKSEGDNTFDAAVLATDEIGVRMVRTSGTGASTFNQINVNVQFG